ncbi:[FeFe] hydrogenase H-cluster maturation GTPase HydF [Pleomorphochaeta sp. DL1XJH-081]|jgi:[FeFe] hydrogenase H-cluster maturation GTPase HydF|uniref:[FeFe] hydrogenase H-cluster maturation GTPase HydF n=1 Tax=Pleomorphochaeta sp. DL1XJH-081 TaxID=3409690 RepID=UPI003BB66827
MFTTPKSLRLHIGLFGRTNVGKSSVLNMIAGQQVAITSSHAGTTTDVVEKSMELLPLGPVVFLDTAGIDDESALASKRIARTKQIFSRADIAVLVTEAGHWGLCEERIRRKAEAHNLPVIVIANKCDLHGGVSAGENVDPSIPPERILGFSAVDTVNRDRYIDQFKQILITLVPEDFLAPPPLLGDLLPSGGHVIFIIPIDIEAPKGRLILPQVQAIRDVLDHGCQVTVVKESGYLSALKRCASPPDLVVCDSQVVDRMVAETPESIPCTTFSTLFSRSKGDLEVQVEGVRTLETLSPTDRILIAESCSHHAMDDDIGRVKIPKWLSAFLGFEVKVDVYSGRDYPDNLAEYALVIHCGACMLTRREMLMRIEKARTAGVPITNYGIAISAIHGRLERILSPFKGLKEIMEREGEKQCI